MNADGKRLNERAQQKSITT